MSNTVKDLRKEFERLSALAALDIYPDYPKLESIDHNITTKKYKTIVPYVQLKSVNKLENSDGHNNNIKSHKEDDSNSVAVSYSKFEDLNDILSDDDKSITIAIDKDREIKELQNNLKRKTSIIQDLEKQVDKLKYKEDEENKEMRESLNELEIILADNKQTRKKLMDENKNLQRQIEHFEQELQAKDAQIVELNEIINKNLSSHKKREGKFHFEIEKKDKIRLYRIKTRLEELTKRIRN